MRGAGLFGPSSSAPGTAGATPEDRAESEALILSLEEAYASDSLHPTDDYLHAAPGEGGAVIRGGEASISFHWEEFERIVLRLRDAGDLLASAERRAEMLAAHLPELFHADDDVRRRAVLVRDALAETVPLMAAARSDAAELADRVVQAKSRYGWMEQHVKAGFSLSGAGAGFGASRGLRWPELVGRDSIESVLALLNPQPEDVVKDWLDRAMESSPELIPLLLPLRLAADDLAGWGRQEGILEAGGVLAYAVGVVAESAGLRARQRPVEIKGREKGSRAVGLGRAQRRGRAAATLHEGLEIAKKHAHAFEERGNSSIVVERAVGRGGVEALVVYLPGSADLFDVRSDNPNGVLGLGDALYGKSAAMRTGVEAALREAGHEPGMPVVLAGHSQGGMHAANLAADPEFVSRFSVRGLYTEGSPVGAVRIDERVQALHLEHATDAVPGLDGAANEATGNRVTVTLPAEPGDADDGGPSALGGASPIGGLGDHGLDLYRRSAERIDALAGHGSLEPVQESLGALIGRGSADGELTVFEVGQRQSAPPPHTSWEWGAGLPESAPGRDWDEALGRWTRRSQFSSSSGADLSPGR